MTVAIAAPPTPIFSWAMKKISSPIFKHEDRIRKTSGIKLLPIARSSPAHRLYANITSVKRVIIEI